MINHYCFAGQQDFRNGWRVLVAGGGTATIYLAEQLRATDAEIVHLDLSAASIAIARRRAEIRRLQHPLAAGVAARSARAWAGRVGLVDSWGSSTTWRTRMPPARIARRAGGRRRDRHDGLRDLRPHRRTRCRNCCGGSTAAARASGSASTMPGRCWPPCQQATNWFARGEQLISDHRRGDADVRPAAAFAGSLVHGRGAVRVVARRAPSAHRILRCRPRPGTLPAGAGAGAAAAAVPRRRCAPAAAPAAGDRRTARRHAGDGTRSICAAARASPPTATRSAFRSSATNRSPAPSSRPSSTAAPMFPSSCGIAIPASARRWMSAASASSSSSTSTAGAALRRSLPSCAGAAKFPQIAAGRRNAVPRLSPLYRLLDAIERLLLTRCRA